MDKIIQPGSVQALAFGASYAAILMILGIVLAARVVRVRRAEQIGVGDGGNKALLRRIRAHGNFSEYAPMIMILLIALPLVGAREWLIHLVGIPALVGRILHAIGLSGSAGTSPQRVFGMVLTFISILFGAIALIVLAWR